jgi:hypothetical protein
VDALGVYAPTFVGLAALAYIGGMLLRIRRQQAKSRERQAAE